MSSPHSEIEADCMVIGGGVIGLSIAWELSGRGKQVVIVDRNVDRTRPGKQASWAGAGIIPAPPRTATSHPAERLHQLSFDLHPLWSERLEAETGIQNGLQRCGGIYIARTAGESASLVANLEMFNHQQINAELISMQRVIELEPALTPLIQSGAIKAALHLPDEFQIRNPRHLKALHVACEKKGVRFVSLAHDFDEDQMAWSISGESVQALQIEDQILVADHYCVAAGAWSYQILKEFGVSVSVYPMLGQMLLFHAPEISLQHIINEGPRYIVSRGDGYLLVGSTEEEVGYENGVTKEGLNDLLAFASTILPELSQSNLKDHWSGLRPATLDGVPYLGSLENARNLFYATGHYRSGLTMSPGTARVITQMIMGEQPEIDVRGLGLQRGL